MNLSLSTAAYPTLSGCDSNERLSTATVISLASFVDYGATHDGTGAQFNYTPKCLFRDDMLLAGLRDRNLGSRVYNRRGVFANTVKADTVQTLGAVGISGVGSVATSRSVVIGVQLPLVPKYKTVDSSDIECSDTTYLTNWRTTSNVVDVVVTPSPNASSYRIHGAQYYGPTGYWVTKNRSDIRINQTVNVEWYATDYECATLNYSLSVNGVVVATGVMNSGAYATHPVLCDDQGDVQLSVTLSDENGKSYELVGPLLQVQNVPIYAGGILLPIGSGRYRVGTPVSVKVYYPTCEAWSVVHRFQSSSVEVGRGTLAIPGEATTEFALLPNPALGTHYLDLVLYDTIGPQDPADTVEFYVIEYDELLSS